MSFRNRLALLVTGLVAIAVLTTAGVLSWNTRQAVLDEVKAHGILLTHVLSRTAALSRDVPDEVESVIGEQMIAQALLTAHFIEAAKKAGMPREAIIERLRGVVADSTIDEFWITDETGRVTLSNLDAAFAFSPDPKVQPQASAFWPLLTGKKTSVVQKARKREIDDRPFKYVGVNGIDKSRIVQVGYDARRLVELSDKIGLKRMVSALLSGHDINAIWVLDANSNTIAHAPVLGADVNDHPNIKEMAAVGQILRTGETISYLTEDFLTVVAPIADGKGHPVGGTVLRLSTRHLWNMLENEILIALGVAGLVIVAGFSLSALLARHVTEPVKLISAAAANIENYSFDEKSLKSVLDRRDELGELARTFRGMAHEVIAREEALDSQVAMRTAELEKKNRELEDSRKRLAGELETAQAMQQAILPTDFPEHEGYSGFAFMVPAREMGGDFYDFFSLEDGRIGVVIADVSGKGVPAAFFMSVGRTIMRSVARRGLPPGECLAEANRRLCAANPMELFITVFYGILDPATGTFRYASGGHNPPILVEADGEATFLAGTDGIALGVMDDMPYDDAVLTMTPGGTLYLYTDGVTEAQDPSGNEFGEDRLVACLKDAHLLSPQALAVKVLDMTDKFAAGAPQADDVTCLVLRFDGKTDGNETASGSRRLDICLRNDLADIRSLASQVERFGATHGVPSGAIFNLNLALDELLTNTVSYGYDDDGIHAILVTLTLEDNTLTAEIEDDGRPFDPLSDAPEPDLDSDIEDRSIGGLGTYFVKAFMDDVSYFRDGNKNRIILTKSLAATDTEEEAS